MFLGESLEIRFPVSPRLLAGVSTIQKILRNWYPSHLAAIEVRAQFIREVSTYCERASRGACFFSGGVDSWYSVLQHRSESPALITVKGFDIPFDLLDPTCAGLGKPFGDDFWGKYAHGAFLAAVGLCLQNHFSSFLVASSYPYIQLHPWGTHPLLDPLWSTELSQFCHDGCDANRMEKIQFISHSQLALNHLRVCSCFSPGRYNCGECEKCRRTMLALRLLGALDQTESFDRYLDIRELVTMRLEPGSEVWYKDMVEFAQATGNADMVDLLSVMLGQKFSIRRFWAVLKDRAVVNARNILN
jgi:hypothetical protein